MGCLGCVGLKMDGGNSGLSLWQLRGRSGIEAGDNGNIVLDGLGVVEGGLTECRVLAAFDADYPGNAVGGSKLNLVSGQRRTSGINEDVHSAKATSAFLTSRLLRWKLRRQPKNNHQQRNPKGVPSFSPG